MNEFAIKKLNSFADLDVSKEVVDWLDNNKRVVINNTLDNLLQDMFNRDDYNTLMEAFEHCFDYYDAVSFEDYMEEQQMDMQIMIEDEDFDYLQELSNDIATSKEQNGSGSMFADGCNMFDGAIDIADFVKFLNTEED